MLNVFLTVDVELWPDSWDLSPRRFSEYFRRYIHGSIATGDYGLPFQLRLLAEHDLKGVFFVESLFACKFGIESLREIVGLIRSAKQEVQAHLQLTARLYALAANQIAIDSSGNAAYGVAFDPKVGVWQPGEIEGVNE